MTAYYHETEHYYIVDIGAPGDADYQPKSKQIRHGDEAFDAFEAARAECPEDFAVFGKSPVFDDATKEQLCTAADARLASLRDKGFLWNGHMIRGDVESANNATAYLTLVAAGGSPVIVWRTMENENITIKPADMPGLGAAMLGFVQQCYLAVWTAKDAIREATTYEAAQKILDALA